MTFYVIIYISTPFHHLEYIVLSILIGDNSLVMRQFIWILEAIPYFEVLVVKDWL